MVMAKRLSLVLVISLFAFIDANNLYNVILIYSHSITMNLFSHLHPFYCFTHDALAAPLRPFFYLENAGHSFPAQDHFAQVWVEGRELLL